MEKLNSVQLQLTVLDGAAHNGLLLFATASGLRGGGLDVSPAPAHPQLQGEVVARQRRHHRVGHHGHMVGAIEGEDQRRVGGGERGQSGGPVGGRRRRREEVHFSSNSAWDGTITTGHVN